MVNVFFYDVADSLNDRSIDFSSLVSAPDERCQFLFFGIVLVFSTVRFPDTSRADLNVIAAAVLSISTVKLSSII